MKEQAIEIKQGVIKTNNNLLFHFNGHNNDLLVLKQLKGAFNRIMTSLFSLLPLLCKKASGSSIILYILHCIFVLLMSY